MSGYLHFSPTNNPSIDRILDTLHEVGNGYHCTSMWDEDPYYGDNETGVEYIERVAMEEAEKLREFLIQAEEQLDHLDPDFPPDQRFLAAWKKLKGES